MIELVSNDSRVEHIPGAGIDFTSVGSVYVVTPEQVGSGLPRTALPGVRLSAPENMLSITLDGVLSEHVVVGDLLLTLSILSDRTRLGRPMQVIHRDADGMTVVLDDDDLPPFVDVGLAFGSAIQYGETGTAWHVLTAFGIGRCPRCQSPGQQLVYGMAIGEPSAGSVLAGCLVPWLNTDLRCPRCHAEWPLPAVPYASNEDDL